MLTRQAAAEVSVGTYWPWETIATLRFARRREALRRPQREERGGAYHGGRPPTACSYLHSTLVCRATIFKYDEVTDF